MIDEESQSNQSDEGDDTPFCSIPFGEIDLVHSAKPLLLISALSMRTNIDENCTGINARNACICGMRSQARPEILFQKAIMRRGNGFDYDLVADLKGYVVQLSKTSKYAPILKNSVSFKETANERIFLMKDLAAVEEAVSLGAKIVDGEVAF